MNRSRYGKTIKNVTKRKRIKFFTDLEIAKTAVAEQYCLDFQAFSNNLLGVQLRKVNQIINKPFQEYYLIIFYNNIHILYAVYSTSLVFAFWK